MNAFIKSAVFVVAASLAATSCTLKNADAPPLTGPSEFGTSVTLTVSPDVLQTDGGSQSLVTITARDANGQPLRNLSLRTETRVNGVSSDFGALSARNVVTDANGQATVVYTAPNIGGGEDLNLYVDVVAIPVSTNAANTVPRSASIRLVPVGVVIPPSGLSPAFTFTPGTAADHENVVFDATTSRSTGLSPIAEYRWDFGDGSTGRGPIVNHAFPNAGTYSVTLTLVDTLGRTASVTRPYAVLGGTNPLANATASPRNPAVGQLVVFNASASSAAAGRRIVRWEWTFGDGETGSGQQVTHAYAQAGAYTAVLTVTDDAGRTDTEDVDVTVGSNGPTATFTVSPTRPTPGQTVNFNASASTAGTGRTIVSYSWDFGDGTTASGVTASKAGGYATVGTYTVTLIVVDDQGNRTVRSQEITVAF
jgi:PKD repeat protein